MIAALAREMPEGTSWNEPDGGYFLWVDLPGGLSRRACSPRPDEVGVTFVKGRRLLLRRRRRLGDRLAFSYATPAAIDEGIARLGRLVREALAVPA